MFWLRLFLCFFFQAEDGIRDSSVTGVQTCALPIDRVMDMAGDVLLHPAFANEEVARYKQRTRAQLMQQRANPGFLANEMFAKAIYGDHPASRTAPSLAAIDALTRDALVEFHPTHYVPDHAVFAIAGDISIADARKIVDAHFTDWKKSGA